MTILEIIDFARNSEEKDQYELCKLILRDIIKKTKDNIIFDKNNISLMLVSFNKSTVKIDENWKGIKFTTEINIDDVFGYIEHKYKIANEKENFVDIKIQSTQYLENHLLLNDIKYDLEYLIKKIFDVQEIDVTYNPSGIIFFINGKEIKLYLDNHGRVRLESKIDMNISINELTFDQINYSKFIGEFDYLKELIVDMNKCLYNMKHLVTYNYDYKLKCREQLIQHIYSATYDLFEYKLEDDRILKVIRETNTKYNIKIESKNYVDFDFSFKRNILSDTDKVKFIEQVIKSV